MSIRKKAGALDMNNDRDGSGGSAGMSMSIVEQAKKALAR